MIFRPKGVVLLALLALMAAPVQAALGPYVHGHGIKSLGFGGIGYAVGDEATVITANPALVGVMEERIDFGLDNALPSARGSIVGNAAGPDDLHISTSKRGTLSIPQGGAVIDLEGPFSMGMTIAVAGLALDYDDNNPYERFGGGEDASILLQQAGILTSLAYELAPEHIVAASLNVVYQSLSVRGATPFAAASQSPGKVSDTGRDGSMGVGFGLGWYKRFTPQFSMGAGYRSKTWTKRHSEYAGLLPKQGKLELPEHYGFGFAWEPTSRWLLAAEVARYEYTKETLFKNGLEKFDQGVPLGADDGPGFGFKDQDVMHLGVAWQATPTLWLRAGYVDGTQILKTRNVFFNFLANMATTKHYTVGYTKDFGGWELSGYMAVAPRIEVKGRNSIPASLGGGEANISNHFYAAGMSIGRRFSFGAQ